MTSFPSIGSYDVAISNFSKFVLAPQFKGGSPILNLQKQILGYSGGYSVVYPIINVSGKKLALKCWIKDPGNVKEHYAIIKTYLQSHPSQYFVNFDYVENGILVNGHSYPIICMEWIEGKTLSQFIDENIQNASVMNALANRLLVMVKELHSKSISHGNLEDGNIIVTHNFSAFDLKLVDYDCLYVPTLQNWNTQDDLQGVPDYQHPKRYRKSNEKTDYFSELVIYLSIIAYAEKPSLWKKGQEKRLLFTTDDFRNPSGSITFRTLETLSPRVKNLANKLKEFCQESDTNLLPPLEQLISYSSDLKDFFSSPSQPDSKPSTPISSRESSKDFSEFFSPTPPHSTANNPPIPPLGEKDARTSNDEKNYRVSISFPRLFSKRFDSVFLFQLYLPEYRSRVNKNIKAQFLDEPRVEFTDQSIIKIGQKIQVEFYNPNFDFSKPVIKLIDGTLIKIVFLGIPKDSCPSGNRNIRVSISNADTQQEIESFNIPVKVVDFAFDHVSRPFISRIGAIILGIGSFAMYILTFLEQIDKTIGLTSGTAAGILAIGIYAGFYSLYKRIYTNTP